MLATGCLRWRDASRALSTQVILIVVASLALGAAPLKTGAADAMLVRRCSLPDDGRRLPGC